MKTLVAAAMAAFLLVSNGVAATAETGSAARERLERILARTPLIDGHNDLAWKLRSRFGDKAASINLQHGAGALMTDIPRLHKGHARDVSDDVLRLVAANGGVAMVNFYPGFVSNARFQWSAARAGEQARLNAPTFGIDLGQPDKASAALAAWVKAHPEPAVGIGDVADHIDHIRKVAGVDHVGLGSDFSGIPEPPTGLDGVDKFPNLLLALMRRGWSDADIAKVAGGNILRVMAEAERVAKRLPATEGPSMATIEHAYAPK
jgi:hypothetical protein